MIEVRIPLSALYEYSSNESLNEYIYGKCLAAGMPLQAEMPENVVFCREGTFEHVGSDPLSNCVIYRWYEKGEFSPEYVH
jgi:hypothetical protein